MGFEIIGELLEELAVRLGPGFVAGQLLILVRHYEKAAGGF